MIDEKGFKTLAKIGKLIDTLDYEEVLIEIKTKDQTLRLENDRPNRIKCGFHREL